MSHLAKIKQLIEDAADLDDLDDSVRLIQDFIDQGDGGIAGTFFSGTMAEQNWSAFAREAKKALLLNYLVCEYQMVVFD